MKLRYVIPMTIFAYAWKDDEFVLEGTFEDGALRVAYGFVGHDNPIENANAAIPFPRLMVYSGLQIEIDDLDSSILGPLVTAKKWDALVAILAKIANRILRAVRNFGVSTNVAEIRVEPIGAESYLRQWLAVTVEGDRATELIATERAVFEEVWQALFSGMESRYGELFAVRWPAIRDAVRENREPGPGQEFIVNAMEHVRRRNLRYALLEAVIALEIAMTSFLRLFLTRRGIPKQRIEQFLSPTLTLHDRISILLDLTSRPRDLQGREIDLAIKAIAWRNDVVHRYGKIRDGIPENVVRDGIWAVIRLAGFLETRYQELNADPEMQAIANEVMEELGRGLAAPLILLRSPEPHHYVAEVVYIADVVPTPTGLQTIVDRLADKLLKRDSAFDKMRRFYVRFVVSPSDVRARWMSGQLTVVGSAPTSS
jgi:hypothetical protein